MSNNFTYVIPVSGNLFPQQLSAMCFVFEKLKQLKVVRSPKIVCSSSGGNISAYISMGSGWEKSNILNTISSFSSDIFVKAWAPFVPSIIVFPMTKTFFRKSDDPENYINKRFNKSSITETEIWSGCFNDSEDKNELFCNLSKDESILDIDSNLLKEMYTNPPNYLDGNIEIIAKTVYASAALPYITEQVDIHDNKYIDGGLMYASPFSCLYPFIRDHYSKTSSKYQVFYFSPVMVSTKPSSLVNIEILSLLLHGSLINDKNYAINGLGDFSDVIHERHDNLEFLNSNLLTKDFVVIMSPKVYTVVDLINVDKGKIMEIINKPLFFCDVYYKN